VSELNKNVYIWTEEKHIIQEDMLLKKTSESEAKNSVLEAKCLDIRRYTSEMLLSQKAFCHRSYFVYRRVYREQTLFSLDAFLEF
jgi:hypothetical protein